MKMILESMLICQLLRISISQMLFGPGPPGFIQPALLWSYQINENSKELHSNSQSKTIKSKDCDHSDHDKAFNQVTTPKVPEFIILPYPVPAMPMPVMPPAPSFISISPTLPNSNRITDNIVTEKSGSKATVTSSTAPTAKTTTSTETASIVTESIATISIATTSTRIPKEIRAIARNLLSQDKNLIYQDANLISLPPMWPLLFPRSTISSNTLKNEIPRRFKIMTIKPYRRRQDYYKRTENNNKLPRYGLVRLTDNLAMSLMNELINENNFIKHNNILK